MKEHDRLELDWLLKCKLEELIPSHVDDDPYTHSRVPIDMIFHGWSISLFQAKQQWSRMSS